jgi:hypothetical protein
LEREVFKGAPELSDFHSADFFTGKGEPYRSLAGETRGKILDGIVEGVRQHRLRPFGVMVDVQAFNSLGLGERRFLTGGIFDDKRWLTSGAPTKPYFLAFGQCLYLIASKVDYGKKANFLFDEQNTFAPNAVALFHDIKHNPQYKLRDRMGACLFLSRREASALCLADLLAYSWYHSWTEGTLAMEAGTIPALEKMVEKSQYRHDTLHRLIASSANRTESLMVFTKENFDLLLRGLPRRPAREAARLHCRERREVLTNVRKSATWGNGGHTPAASSPSPPGPARDQESEQTVQP